MVFLQMIRVESSKEMGGFTEFEEDILFDDDDPDFDHVHAITVPIVFKGRLLFLRFHPCSKF